MRKDPPADAAYLFATMLLSLVDRARTFVLNDPAGLREANEKLYALNFPDAIPPTLVTHDLPRLKQFMVEQGGEMIVKPLDGHGGEGVFLASARRPQPERDPRSRHPFRDAPDHGAALHPRNPRRRQAADRARRRAAGMHAARAARRRESRQHPRRRQLRQGRSHRARSRDLPDDAAAARIATGSTSSDSTSSATT